jgi:Nucleotide modification associated domain 2
MNNISADPRPKIYLYKLVADNGGAPCVQNGLLSLAICKPMIRETAEEGDLIFGFAGNSLNPDNPLIYVARVTKKLCDDSYYRSGHFSKRADCIYRFANGLYSWRKGAEHHGPRDLVHDLGKPPLYSRANVLLSTDFRYFGKAATDKYKSKFRLVRDAVRRLGRGQRIYHDAALREELLKLAAWVWRSTSKKKIGRPNSGKSTRTCHRSGPCGTA